MDDLQALEAALLSGVSSNIYEGYCYIDPITRTISIPSEETLFGVESDEESHRVYFYTSKVVGDNFDLSKARVQINFRTPDNEIGVYLVQDLQVDEGFVTFSWSIRRMVTQYRGEVAFIVCATIPGEGDIDKEWNTTVAKGRVLEGIEAQGQVETIKEDLLGQLIAAADEASNAVEWAVNAVESAAAESVDKAVTEITAKGEDQKKQISAQGEQTLKSIPTEYTALYNQVQQNTLEVSRSAPAIIPSAAGEFVSITDSAERPLAGLRLYGKTTQNGAPTPSAPVPLVNVGAGGSITITIENGGVLTASTPGGLAGIPSAGGLLCDYKDYGSGMHIQHVQRIVLDGDENITFDEDAFNVAGAIQSGGKAYMQGLCDAYPVATNYGEFISGDFAVCNWSNDALRIRHGGSTDVAAFRAWLAANPVTLYFPLPNAASTPIPADEMAAFRAMKTHKPNTTVYNDAEAFMYVDYIADTKTYIERNDEYIAQMFDRIFKLEDRTQNLENLIGSSSGNIRDPYTGKNYQLGVENGKLILKEVTV